MSKYSSKIAVEDFKDYEIKTQIAANTEAGVKLWHKCKPTSGEQSFELWVNKGYTVNVKDGIKTLEEAVQLYNTFIER